MSSRTYYYVPSPIELANGRIAALAEQLEAINRFKDHLLASMDARADSRTESRVEAVSFGELAVEALEGVDVDALVTATDERNLEGAETVGGVIDFADRFASDTGATTAGGAADYLEAAKRRASRLVALSSTERDAIRRFVARCDELAAGGGTAEDVRPFVEKDLELLCSQLGEADSAHRADLYLDYLALCAMTGEEPGDHGLTELEAAVQRMREDLARRAFHARLSSIFDEAMEEVGLTSVGAMSLDEREGRLVVGDDADECALFVSESGDGSFVFTTVTADDTSAMTPDEQFAVRRSATSLCEKKERLLNEALARRGLVAEVRYDYPVDLRLMVQSDEFARYRQSRSSARRHGGDEAARGSGRAE